MNTYIIHHTGFHGRAVVRFRGEGPKQSTIATGEYAEIPVSRRVARRLNAAVCGLRDCRCGEAVARLESYGPPERWVVHVSAPVAA